MSRAPITGSTRPSRGRVPDRGFVAALTRRDRLLIIGCLIVITVLAWVYLLHLEAGMSTSVDYDAAMAAMGMTTSWSAADFWYTFSMWIVMMIGMMTAAAAPVLLLFAATAAQHDTRAIPLSVLTFGLGYL